MGAWLSCQIVFNRIHQPPTGDCHEEPKQKSTIDLDYPGNHCSWWMRISSTLQAATNNAVIYNRSAESVRARVSGYICLLQTFLH